jgi:hypothetical protein
VTRGCAEGLPPTAEARSEQSKQAMRVNTPFLSVRASRRIPSSPSLKGFCFRTYEAKAGSPALGANVASALGSTYGAALFLSSPALGPLGLATVYKPRRFIRDNESPRGQLVR